MIYFAWNKDFHYICFLYEEYCMVKFLPFSSLLRINGIYGYRLLLVHVIAIYNLRVSTM